MRRSLIVSNWKMNGTEAEAAALVGSLLTLLPDPHAGPEIALAPPFTSLRSVAERIRSTGISLAAQNLHSATHGAFTGEISGAMLSALGVRYVIVGHSERRRLSGESDEDVARKVAAARLAGLITILCVGEEDADRRKGRTLEVIERQVRAGFERTDPRAAEPVVLAYEPIWAIGTGRTASPAQASEVHLAIRDVLKTLAGEPAADEARILYGGSVTAENASGLLRSPGIDGALVGGASLVAESFAKIAAAAGSSPAGA